MNLQELLALSDVHLSETGQEWKDYTPRVYCMNGDSLSVQASSMVYCTPRSNHGPWYQVEVGYPSRAFEKLKDYAEDWDAGPTDTVYGYVPIEIVEDIIAECGGICVETTILKKESMYD